MQYVLLMAAIASEVTGTLALRVAAGGRHLFYGVVVVGYVVAFTLLSASLQHGMPLGIAYGIWAAAGVALTAAAAEVLAIEIGGDRQDGPADRHAWLTVPAGLGPGGPVARDLLCLELIERHAGVFREERGTHEVHALARRPLAGRARTGAPPDAVAEPR